MIFEDAVERIEYEIDLEGFPHVIAANAASEFVIRRMERKVKE